MNRGLKNLASGVVVPTVLVLMAALRLNAQQYTIDWSTFGGGGGTSTGGVFTASGTIGQPDAGTLNGGNFSVQGGFWGIVAAVQATNAPLLSITRTATNTIIIAWPSPSDGWNLFQNSSLAPTGWVTPPQTVTNDSTSKFILINPPAGNRFYRLAK